MGHISGITFNWWNVMEFSLGFFGGLGMTYGVTSSSWPESATPSRSANNLALVMLVLAIPATNLIQAFDTEKFTEMAINLGITNPDSFVRIQLTIGWAWLILGSGVTLYFWFRSKSLEFIYTFAPAFFFGYTALYIIESHVRKGFFFGATDSLIPQYLYWVDLIVLGILLYFMNKKPVKTSLPLLKTAHWSSAYKLAVSVVLIMGLLSLVSISLHDGIPGAQERFSGILP